MAKRKHRPSDPATIARKAYEQRRNPAAWGTNDEALRLPQNESVHTTQDETRTRTRRVERFDCFATLEIPAADVGAIRRYQEILAIIHRCGGADAQGERVDGRGSAELVTIKWIDASNRRDELVALLKAWEINLLDKLSIPSVVEGREPNWHNIVRTQTGLIDRDAQSSCVKRLSASVRLAYAEIDNQMRRAA